MGFRHHKRRSRLPTNTASSSPVLTSCGPSSASSESAMDSASTSTDGRHWKHRSSWPKKKTATPNSWHSAIAFFTGDGETSCNRIDSQLASGKSCTAPHAHDSGRPMLVTAGAARASAEDSVARMIRCAYRISLRLWNSMGVVESYRPRCALDRPEPDIRARSSSPKLEPDTPAPASSPATQSPASRPTWPARRSPRRCRPAGCTWCARPRERPPGSPGPPGTGWSSPWSNPRR